MKHLWLVVAAVLSCSQPGHAIYGPSLVRAAPSISTVACTESNFSHSQQIAGALRDENPVVVAELLGAALAELQNTPSTSALYPARAFCIHELLPSSLDADTDPSTRTLPTADVKQFQSLGIDYFYYEPDGRWTLREDPVDLNQLATTRLDSRWGREAFVMMTQIGWSKGGCREGPNQFLEVIEHGKRFLREYPNSEVSAEVRRSMADAYATWWSLSREDADSLRESSPIYAEWLNHSKEGTNSDGSSVNIYERGSQEAKQAAIGLYREYLKSQKEPDQQVQQRLKDLLENPNGSQTFDYFCADYED